MRVSRHTFGRTLAEARRAVADALVNGRALCIEGGTYAVLPPQPEADKPHKEFHMQKVPFPAKALRSTIWWTRASGGRAVSSS